MIIKFILLLICIFLTSDKLVHKVNSAKILCIYPTPSQSHFIIAQALLYELINRGHEVRTCNTKFKKYYI